MSDRKIIDDMLEEMDREKTEKTLDEALEEMDRWAEPVVEALNTLSSEELREYFRQAQVEFEKLLGKPLKKAVRQPRFKTEG